MKGFTSGLMCGAAAVTLLGASLAFAQARVFPALTGSGGGLTDGRHFTVACTNAQGTLETGRRMVTFRPQGDTNSPQITLQCQ